MTSAALVCRIILAAVFLIAGLAKLVDPARSESLSEFGVPRRMAAPAGLALPVVELAVAAALFPDEKLAPAAVLLSLIVGVLAVAPYTSWRQKVLRKDPHPPGDSSIPRGSS